MQLGARIRLLRREKGLSLRALAEQGGLSAGHLSQVENGKAENVGLETLGRIATALGTTLPQLVAGVEVPDTAYPEELTAFIGEMAGQGQPLEAGMVTLLRLARSLKPGGAPWSVEDWRTLYYGLLAVVKVGR